MSEDAPPKKHRRKKKLPKIISAAEADSLLRAADDGTDIGLRNRCILELMYRAGLRVSEVVGLAPRDVERDGIVRLYDAKGGDGTAYFDADRILPLLDRWLEVRHMWPVAQVNRLFVHPNGSAISTCYVQRLVEKLKGEIGVTGTLTPHTLRHTFATELIEEGVPIHEVQSALRHANLATTAVYLSVRDENLRKRIAGRKSRPV